MATQKAQLNYLKIAPRKGRLVADSIKGLAVNDAEAQLMLQPRRSAQALLKLLRSSVANAKNNQKLDTARLFVQSIRVDQGPMLKRYLPRARGSATPIQRKMSHVMLVLGESEKARNDRFKIVIQKKLKDKELKKSAKTRESRTIGEERMVSEKPKEKQGFLKRIFRRKSV